MKALFDEVSAKTSKLITKSYSTSFSMGIRLLAPKLRNPIYAIYGFVRIADEIVDSFHAFNKLELLEEFKLEVHKSIAQGISLNPVLNSFQQTVNAYQIPLSLIDTFLYSMEMDLNDQTYDHITYEKYILGSAEVVGLMCLKVFVEGNESKYQELKPYAMKLGSAFQKINFLRDFKSDTEELGRRYFPELQFNEMNQETKLMIEKDIENDFAIGLMGIMRLPKEARFGVYIAYIYYKKLLAKIKQLPAQQIMKERVRVPNKEKFALVFGSYLRHSFNLL